jgi:hypothetical protein
MTWPSHPPPAPPASLLAADAVRWLLNATAELRALAAVASIPLSARPVAAIMFTANSGTHDDKASVSYAHHAAHSVAAGSRSPPPLLHEAFCRLGR